MNARPRMFVLSALLAAGGTLGGCGDAGPDIISVAGDPQRGRLAADAYGCGTCHVIPGVRGANGQVGPPLGGMAERAYLGGVIPNSPESMVRWIRNPRAIDPRTAMPDTGVSEADARDITAYLYTLK